MVMPSFIESGHHPENILPLETASGLTSEQERPAASEAEIATRQMTRLAEQVNADLGEKIVGPDGRLKMPMFAQTLGSDRVRLESAVVRSIRVEQDELDDPLIRQAAIERLGLVEKSGRLKPDELTDALIRGLDREKTNWGGNLAEVTATLLLHRGLSENFITVRTAAYDDLKHGIDTIIVNKETGEVICAFDELMGGGPEDKRAEEKARRQQEDIKRGGTSLTYGFTIKDGQMVKSSFEHVPIFRLCLGRREVYSALTECDHDGDDLGPIGKNILDGLLASLAQQTGEYLTLDELNPVMRQRLEHFRDGSLAKMQAMIAQPEQAAA
jgi:hypothetical protein